MNKTEINIRNYLDGSLSGEQERKIALLIDKDAAYREEFEELIRLRDGFDNLLLPEAPTGLTSKIMSAYRVEMLPTVFPPKAKMENKFEKLILNSLLLVPLAMLIIYGGIEFSHANIHRQVLSEEIKSSWIIWALILLNLFYGTRLVIKSHQFTNSKIKIQ
ncbi:MAG: hypothetical protein JWM28_4025 [Chitinophagaceae bacterium]|nr:hypothetical protein [Chitinophagaceae bacterium]